MPFDFKLPVVVLQPNKQKEIWIPQGSITVQLLPNSQMSIQLQDSRESRPGIPAATQNYMFCWNITLYLLPFFKYFSLSLSLSYTRTHPYSAHYRMVVNASGSPVLWRVNERGFICSSILNSTTTRFLQASDGLVVSEDLLALGQNYFLSKIRSASHLLKKAFFIHWS